MEKILTRVKNIILNPAGEWQAIKSEQTTTKDIILGYVAPLAAITPIAYAIGLGVVGMSFMGQTMRYPFGYLMPWAVVYYIMNIVGVFVGAAAVNTLAGTFESKRDVVQALKVVAYSFTPAWIAGILHVFPHLSVIVILASLYGIYLLYIGLRPLMETPESKALGYTVASIIAMIIIVIIVNFLSSTIVSLLFFSGRPVMPMMPE